jgi:protein-tyrosine phosphatase
MVRLLALINSRLQTGCNLYIHCYAGIGRTGTVVGCFLAEQSGSGEAALKQLELLRRRLPNAHIRSPESDAQASLVRNWKKAP